MASDPQAIRVVGAIEMLASDCSVSHPAGSVVLLRDRYVDDVLSGSNSFKEHKAMIEQTHEILGRGGFDLKFVCESGHQPSPDASNDGESLKILGYKWTSKEDQLSPGFEELNFNRKKRGVKKPNEHPLVDSAAIQKVLLKAPLTRRKVVEIF